MKIEQLDMEQAACKDVDPDMFFPEQGSKYKTDEAAKAVCGSCAIKFDCLQVALANNYDGVWGGLNTLDRESLKRRERRARRGRVHENSLANLRVEKSVQQAHLAAANAKRAENSAARSVAVVKQALETIGDNVPENLLKVAQARLENPKADLSELASLLGVTKDSYSGALRRLLKLANK
jgi:WhiB family transcriptional regulator, redox-sensing transcriptional regulator